MGDNRNRRHRRRQACATPIPFATCAGCHAHACVSMWRSPFNTATKAWASRISCSVLRFRVASPLVGDVMIRVASPLVGDVMIRKASPTRGDATSNTRTRSLLYLDFTCALQLRASYLEPIQKALRHRLPAGEIHVWSASTENS